MGFLGCRTCLRLTQFIGGVTEGEGKTAPGCRHWWRGKERRDHMDERTSSPAFTGRESQEEKIQRILDCLYQMNEQYRYILCQLDSREE